MSSEQERDDLCLQKIYEWCSGSENFIHFACRNGMLKVVKWLIDCKADLNVFDDEKFTPLHRMAIVGNIEMVNVLLENGADIDVPDGRWGCSPLLFAAQEGKMEIVKINATVIIAILSGAPHTLRIAASNLPPSTTGVSHVRAAQQ